MQRSATGPDRRRSTWVCALIGVGLMAAIDEIVFHQLLSWHHFYDRSTSEVALMSDGILHAARRLRRRQDDEETDAQHRRGGARETQ